MQLICEKLALRFKTVREAFQHYDADLSGSIEENEFRDCRAWLGLAPHRPPLPPLSPCRSPQPPPSHTHTNTRHFPQWS